MPIDDRTTNRSYKLPNAGNHLADDVVRLRDALAAIDADVYARYTKLEVDQLITNLIAGAPGALNTLDELAAALGDDANFAATVTNQLALKANASNVYSKAESDARYVQGQTQAEMVFTATASQSVFTLSTAVINKPSALVTVDGVVQPSSEYSINMTGTQLTLSEGVPAGTVVRVLALGVSSEGAPADDTVTTVKLRDGAVTTSKIADSAITSDKIAPGAVATDDIANSALSATTAGRAKMADGFVTPAKLSQPMTLATAQNTTSGTAIDFGIPSWVKKITVMFSGVSLSGTADILVRIGTSSGIESTSYASSSTAAAAAVSTVTSASGFIVAAGGVAAAAQSGHLLLTNLSGNLWVSSHIIGRTDIGATRFGGGDKTLSGTLDRLRLTTTNGTDTFDSGSVNILYEG